MRVLVCGSRTFADRSIIDYVLTGLYANRGFGGPVVLIHGGARGADALVNLVARGFTHVKVEPYPADWGAHGKAAGPIRNQQMLDEGKPDVVIAFVDKPLAESRGTADMVRRARKAGILTYVIEAQS